MKKPRKRTQPIEALLAAGLQPNRPHVKLPPFRGPGLLESLDGAGTTKAINRWLDEAGKRVLTAVGKLAAEAGADRAELVKVAWQLVELVPPKSSGRPRTYQMMDVLLPVAVAMKRGVTQRVACELIGIEPDTFRKYRDANPGLWRMLQATATEESLRFLKP